jgi:hypothetical protein
VELARIVEWTWDEAEEHGGELVARQVECNLFLEIDGAMDAFIKPIILYGKVNPDLLKVNALFNDYLEKFSFPLTRSQNSGQGRETLEEDCLFLRPIRHVFGAKKATDVPVTVDIWTRE